MADAPAGVFVFVLFNNWSTREQEQGPEGRRDGASQLTLQCERDTNAFGDVRFCRVFVSGNPISSHLRNAGIVLKSPGALGRSRLRRTQGDRSPLIMEAGGGNSKKTRRDERAGRGWIVKVLLVLIYVCLFCSVVRFHECVGALPA